ncbi:MAG TPA: hypothetical protein VF610_03180, partial [Segetibacter sp.]
MPILLMSKRCKVRSKRIFAFGLIAIVFIITIQVNARHNRKYYYPIKAVISDTPPPAKKPLLRDTSRI